MKLLLQSVALLLVVLGCPDPILSGDGDDLRKFNTLVSPFLNTYCFECHSGDDPAGDRQFESLSGVIRDDNSLVDLQDMLDQLNLGEMPPQEAAQPPGTERQEVIRWLTLTIERYHETRRDTRSETVLRRLNAREYRNTVRDLLHLNLTMFDPAEHFPLDSTTEHFDNVGDVLVTSGYLLAEYLDAAERVVDKAFSPLERPKVRSWRFVDGFRQQPEIDKVHIKTNGHEHLTLYDVVGADKHEGAYAPIHAFAQGVPSDGTYEIRFKAEAVNRDHPYDDAFLGIDRSEPLRLGIVAGNQLAGALHKPQPIEPILAEVDLADEMSWYTVRVWLDRGFTPRFTFRNGLMDARTLWTRVQRKYPDLFPGPRAKGIVQARMNAIANGKLPQIRIDEIEIEGPLYDQWPTPSQRVLFGDHWEHAAAAATGELSDELLRDQLGTLISGAYRRPARAEDIERIMSVIVSRRATGRSSMEAYADGLKAVLCSPSFLFLDDGNTAELSSWALASRLSYFLWSSMPDQELFDLAESGRIRAPEVLTRQVDRMLSDPKSNAFVDGFLDSWLTLRDLGSTPPDRGDFKAYFHYDLGHAMREETRLFTRYLIDENMSIENFVDSNFTFVNKRLAAHYDLKLPEGTILTANAFQRVTLRGRRRGGLLGQASVLTVTANGIDTSPVVRGVWLLENILGTPPSPPPPDVEPLDPDVRGAKTIRDQLAKHRNVPSCNECHRKIDPLGFALENFDPIGGWRTFYNRRAKIDASGKLPSGQSFDDIQGLKRILLGRKDLFAKALTEKLVAYSLGRRITPTDRPHTDHIVRELRERGYGLRDLIELVVTNELFRAR